MNNKQLNDLFLRIAEELDISDTLFERAETSYQALGEYINNHCDCSVNVYTQGSFRLGTVIRPLNDEDEYDLDLVSEVTVKSHNTPKNLKNKIGDILRDSKRYSTKLEEKKRCWRIEYSDEAQFHMDITPAIPESSTTSSILVTDKHDDGAYTYIASNPKGYSEWFEKRKSIVDVQKKALNESVAVEPVITNKVKLPLQRAVQILKRHRDKVFESNPDDKPVSIIITTLAAQAYNGETGVYDALKRILETMALYVKFKNGKYCIPNPSNPQENFADKWNNAPEKSKAFYDWLGKVKNDVVVAAPSIIDDYSVLEESIGDVVVERAISETNPVVHNSNLPTAEYSNPIIKTALGVSHRQRPTFKLPKHKMLGIKATVTEGGIPRPYSNNGQAIPKNCSIDFNLVVSQTLLKGNYSVWWQVVNTGSEAQAACGLRGGFEKEMNSTMRHEATQYRGTHFVQAFLIKRDSCIAMSSEFIVNIR